MPMVDHPRALQQKQRCLAAFLGDISSKRIRDETIQG
jgi:hypothetical protein